VHYSAVDWPGNIKTVYYSLKECVLFLQHAHALELLSDMMYDGAHVLDVGSGSGYLTACMAMLVIDFVHYSGLWLI